MIGVLDYGCGNIKSLSNALTYLNIPFEIVETSSALKNFDKLILPGLGAFGSAMQKLVDRGFQSELSEFIDRGGHLLGICVGMQILFEERDEFGVHKGLGFLPGRVIKIEQSNTPNKSRLKLPHIGWRNLTKNRASKLEIGIDSKFYFIHSYKVECEDKLNLYFVEHGNNKIPAIVNYKNIFGVQFHPEKSRSHGLELLKTLL